MMCVVALQNLVAYSVNMADNVMLGSFSQAALSGAATVNQVFFMIQCYANAGGSSLSILSSQYWGKGDSERIKVLTGIVVRFSLLSGAAILLFCSLFSRPLLKIFTNSEVIIAEGQAYLALIQWSFVFFILTTVLTSLLRSVGTVNISFYISFLSLLVNVSINYTLIFGHFGFPRLGIRGAAVGTLVARALELVIVFVYMLKAEKKLCFEMRDFFQSDAALRRSFFKVYWPTCASQMVWAVSVPLQTAILGHLSDDALAANSVATTFFQYLKVIVQAMSSTAAVLIGNAIGRGDIEEVKREARTISLMDVTTGVILALCILALKDPLLSLYELSPSAMTLTSHLIVIMGFVMAGMSYQMPISTGILTGGGDVRFRAQVNLISTWLIVMPLSFASAFWWKWSVEAVVICIQSDQIFKCLPCGIRLHSYKWIHNLTSDKAQGNGA